MRVCGAEAYKILPLVCKEASLQLQCYVANYQLAIVSYQMQLPKILTDAKAVQALVDGLKYYPDKIKSGSLSDGGKVAGVKCAGKAGF